MLAKVERIIPSTAVTATIEVTKVESCGMLMFAPAPRVADDSTDALQNEQHMFPARVHNHKSDCYCVSCTELTSLMTCIGDCGKVWMLLDMNAPSAQWPQCPPRVFTTARVPYRRTLTFLLVRRNATTNLLSLK